MTNCGIYIIKNKVNGKVYIGSSKRIDHRWKEHISYLNNNKHHSIILQKSWNKHSQDNFEFSILELCDEDKLIEREQYYMDLYKSYDKNNGYNISRTSGRMHSDQIKEYLNDPIIKAKHRNNTIAAMSTEEYKKKHHDGLIKSITPERRMHMSIKTKERNKDPEYLKKWKESCKKIWNTEDYKIKQSKKIKESVTAESRQKISESSKKMWNNEDKRKKLSKEISDRYKDQSFVEKCRIASTTRHPIRCIETGIIYNSVSEAARQLNTSRKAIRNSIKRGFKVNKMYHFEYIIEIEVKYEN